MPGLIPVSILLCELFGITEDFTANLLLANNPNLEHTTAVNFLTVRGSLEEEDSVWPRYLDQEC